MKNIKLTIEYDGSHYAGWQKQKNGPSIQQTLEKAVLQLTGETVIVNGSGRTDAKVHAYGQTASFKTLSSIPPDSFYKALNQKLPDDIKCVASCEVEDSFHARFSATGKHYRYIILNRNVKPAISRNYSGFYKERLDTQAMGLAIKEFEGEHDFRGFMSTGSDVKNTFRTIYETSVNVDGDFIILDFKGNGFLYNMVRIIVGTLIDVGLGKINANDIKDIILSKDRKRAGKTAKASGLYLMAVYYDKKIT
ncbi:MAG: tRNA pseudouridine(38-40) synthase TruA [Clostridia bacterium]|nr:tRNA pseudouridine(38-40) synthase TruA [Clostridia bacterium]